MNEGLKRVKARIVGMRLVKIVASAFRLGRDTLLDKWGKCTCTEFREEIAQGGGAGL